jgi:hypothetical protein
MVEGLGIGEISVNGCSKPGPVLTHLEKRQDLGVSISSL